MRKSDICCTEVFTVTKFSRKGSIRGIFCNTISAILLQSLLLATHATLWFHSRCNMRRSAMLPAGVKMSHVQLGLKVSNDLHRSHECEKVTFAALRCLLWQNSAEKVQFEGFSASDFVAELAPGYTYNALVSWSLQHEKKCYAACRSKNVARVAGA